MGDHGCEYMTGGKVIVLGETGKNFAAGMSGGIAYIYDENNIFEKNCNVEMVDLEIIDDPTEETWLKNVVQKHHQLTGSEIGEILLKNWEKVLTKFIKVMPIEYRAVLAQRQKESIYAS